MDFRIAVPLTIAQRMVIQRMVANGWQNIADDTVTFAAILTKPVGMRWLDAHVQQDGTVTYERG